MNPFELAGPQFLAVYATLGILVVWSVYVLKQQAEGGEPVNLPSMDPYLIAYLRGGATEAVRLGVAVLVDRQLLAFDPDDTVTRREHVSPAHGRNDLEQAILEQCASADAPRDLAVNRRLQSECYLLRTNRSSCAWDCLPSRTRARGGCATPASPLPSCSLSLPSRSRSAWRGIARSRFW